MLYSVKPFISTTTLTVGTTINSVTVTSSAAFGSVVAGQTLFGLGIQFGTKVVSVESTSSITISLPATVTNASASVQFSYFTSAAYTAGDCVGFPFQLPMNRVFQINVIDNDKVIATSIKVYVFRDRPVVTLDNAAFAPSDADAANILAFMSISSFQTLGNNIIANSAISDQPVDMETAKTKYCQLVCGGTPTFTAVNSLTVNFVGE